MLVGVVGGLSMRWPAACHLPVTQRPRTTVPQSTGSEWDVGGVDVETFLQSEAWLNGALALDDDLIVSAAGEDDELASELAQASQQYDRLLLRSPTGTPTLARSISLEAAVLSDGVGRTDRSLSAHTAAALRAYALGLIEEDAATPCSDGFSTVLSERAAPGAVQTRWDIRLPLVPLVEAALAELLKPGTPLTVALERVAGGLEAELYELGTFVSQPGAAAQLIHADTLFSDEPCLFTATVALQDVREESGPTLFLPGTHTAEAHAAFDDDVDSFFDSQSPVLACAPTGGVVLYDSRCFHCGGPNRSEEPRALFYFTFRHPDARADMLGNPAARTMRAELHGRFCLGDLLG
ncbi:hypothetical protein AB1Y20_009405 [Prymnesium parvum]|uniref:Phytanoyl-CoA dioxygenase family protein n=1 Tax=Prymnesium parvum TaxID=97485 RepID=A0AB34K1C6_PRYPA